MLNSYHSTSLGKMIHGNSLEYMPTLANKSIDLIMTSPPFGLVRKKSYGNKDAADYCQWFKPFADEFKRILKPTGSLVIDIGGSWNKGMPTRSLYHFELLLMLCKEHGFHLCEEHFWWNPAKLPTPAEWVNIRRVRVKDAVNCIWWLSPTPYPKANNRKVLAPYSTSMKNLLENGYKPKKRPSGHDISDKFGTDNGGSVPPNLLAIANTESTSKYQAYCKKHGHLVHPARFPSLLPEYFIKFLTDPKDSVLDPFAGSCVTGEVAERLNRNWTCIELDDAYLAGAIGRFEQSALPSKPASYSLNTPCSLVIDESSLKTIKNGGKTR